jgi:hypothetical protein
MGGEKRNVKSFSFGVGVKWKLKERENLKHLGADGV